MCYKKPAPRCSTHAREALHEAHRTLVFADRDLKKAQAEFESKRDAASEAKLRESEATFKKAGKDASKAKAAYDKAAEDKKAAYKKFREAQKDYALTPEGIEKVRESGDGEKADRLAVERKRLIDASKVAEANEADAKVEVSPRVKAVFDNPDDRNAWREATRNGSTEELRQLASISTENQDPKVVASVSERLQRVGESVKKHQDTTVLTACLESKAMQPAQAHALFMGMRGLAERASYEKADKPWVALEQPGVLQAFKARADAESEVYVNGRNVTDKQLGTTLNSEIADYQYKLDVAPQIDAISQAGGREWVGGDKHRVYMDFDKAVASTGGSVEAGSQGVVKNLVVDGQELNVPNKFTGSGIFFDVKAGRWNLTGNDGIDKALAPGLNRLSQPKTN